MEIEGISAAGKPPDKKCTLSPTIRLLDIVKSLA
jgi:hypothetical protein